MIARGIARLFGWLVLFALVTPPLYACWLSFSPDAILTPPIDEWSLRWYGEFVRSPRWMIALKESLFVGILAVVFSLGMGLPLAYALVRLHARSESLMLGVLLLPLAAPPLLLSIGLLPTLQTLGLWGSSAGLALAHSLYGMPMVCWLTRIALRGVNPEIEQAARGLGANAWQAAYRITLPLIGPSVVAGAVMAFVLSLNELILSLFLATPETETLPRIVWPNLRYAISPLVAVASCLTTLATVAGIGVATWLVWRWRLR